MNLAPMTPLTDSRLPSASQDRHRVYHPPSGVPLGPIEIHWNAQGLTWLSFHTRAQDETPSASESLEWDDLAFTECARQLDAYFQRRLRVFELPLAPRGTSFQRRVWEGLAEIPYGETRSYGQLAAQLGHPDAARAVGAANGRNPVSIVVPCHRVIGGDGRLTGYAGGLARKRWLLRHEGIDT